MREATEVPGGRIDVLVDNAGEQRPERALVPLSLVALDHHVPPPFPRLPGAEGPQTGLLVLDDLVRLERRSASPGSPDGRARLTAGRETIRDS
ncbi:hypothetical protein ACIGXF_27645 [Streptomyces sp. NPDC053086]|uniref:hypothetical protein n=1 Tax=unclassified Streptomyces TaxID=2593676 RepID=UPI0037D0CDEF